MAVTSRQINNSLLTRAQEAPNFAQITAQSACSNCDNEILAKARYCGECGTKVLVKEALIEQVHHAPAFAEVHTHQLREAPKELTDELDKVFAFLVRERFFLSFHYCIYVAMNLLGFSLAFKAYNEFIGDDTTRLVVALLPFSVINLLAFLCFAQIRGTQRQIARLKERLNHLRYKIEYWGLI